jgi:hypothetical protein
MEVLLTIADFLWRDFRLLPLVLGSCLRPVLVEARLLHRLHGSGFNQSCYILSPRPILLRFPSHPRSLRVLSSSRFFPPNSVHHGSPPAQPGIHRVRDQWSHRKLDGGHSRRSGVTDTWFGPNDSVALVFPYRRNHHVSKPTSTPTLTLSLPVALSSFYLVPSQPASAVSNKITKLDLVGVLT